MLSINTKKKHTHTHTHTHHLQLIGMRFEIKTMETGTILKTV